MQADFARALPRILVYEGGKVDNPRDPGGRTNKGITQATFNAYRRERNEALFDVYGITDSEVAEIYKNRYWDVVRGDDLPVGLDLVVFDGAVNSGPAQSVKWLQHALGDHFSGAVDGLIGPKTLQAIEDFADVETLIEAHCSHRLATLQRLKTWSTFGKGWSARIANVLKAGDAWAAQADEPAAVDVSAAGGHRKASISDIKTSKVSSATAHATTIASTAGAVASNATANLAPVQQALPHFAWLGYAMGGLAAGAAIASFVVKSLNDLRAEAAKGSATAKVDLDADAGHPHVSVTPLTPKAV